jgi:ABC-type branched-subunit amino acid transport system substrate-binding protein
MLQRRAAGQGGLGAVVACVVAATVLLLAAACDAGDGSEAKPVATSGATQAAAPALKFPEDHVPVSAPGVTDTEINVTAIAAITNPLGMKNASTIDGAQAYFDMVNAAGGIYGRKIVFKDKLDDRFTNNSVEVERVLAGGNTFAVVPVSTTLFNGADALSAAKMPTFGWLINTEWGATDQDPRLTMFGQTRSFLGAAQPQPMGPYLVKQAGKHNVGLLTYSAAQAAECATGTQKSFDQWGGWADAKIAFVDGAVPLFNTDYSVQVSKMKDANVDAVFTCLDTNGVVALAREIKKQGLPAIQIINNGYDPEFLAEYGDLLEGSLIRVDFTPIEVPVKPAGLQRFEEWMKKGGYTINENSGIGWLNADLFVSGLVGAGPNFSQASVVDAINKMTKYTAEGMLHGVDWTKAHTSSPGVICGSVVTVKDGSFVPTAGQSDSNPWACPIEQGGQIVNGA